MAFHIILLFVFKSPNHKYLVSNINVSKIVATNYELNIRHDKTIPI